MDAHNKYLDFAIVLTRTKKEQCDKGKQIKELDSIVELGIAEYNKLFSYFHYGILPECWYGEKNVLDTIEVLSDRAHWMLIYMAICKAIKKTEMLTHHTDSINFKSKYIKDQVLICTGQIMKGNSVNKSVADLLAENRSLFYQLEPIEETDVQMICDEVCEQLEKYDSAQNRQILFR